MKVTHVVLYDVCVHLGEQVRNPEGCMFTLQMVQRSLIFNPTVTHSIIIHVNFINTHTSVYVIKIIRWLPDHLFNSNLHPHPFKQSHHCHLSSFGYTGCSYYWSYFISPERRVAASVASVLGKANTECKQACIKICRAKYLLFKPAFLRKNVFLL